MEELPPIALTAIGYAEQAWAIVEGWPLSPAAWSQFALLVGAFVLAVIVKRRLKPALIRLIAPAPEADGVIASARRFVAAVSTHPGVLQNPEPPDVELAGFGDSGIDFAVEFWVNGLDDGPNKYSSEVRFLIWNALKDAGIEIPYPHRVVELRGALPQ